MSTKQETCEERCDASLASILDDLHQLWEADHEEGVEDLGTFNEYALSFDYVAPGTFGDQDEGFWRYQISTGGPGEEFRFFASSPKDPCYKIQFWFLDWFDGAHRNLHGAGLELLEEIWQYFQETGSTAATYDGTA